MNATYSMDHIEAITHISSLLGASNAAAAGNAAINKPKSATTQHYDPLGSEVATVSNTSYEALVFGADGKIAGGNLLHESTGPDGKKLSTTGIDFRADGKPASAVINIHNTRSDGDFKKVQMDLSGVTWNNSLAISSGEVKVNTIDALTQAKTHEGTIQFDKESLVSGSFTHFSKDKAGEVEGYTQVDYSTAKFLGTHIVGGQYAIHSLKPDKTVGASSVVSLSPLGRLQSIETKNMGDASAVKTTVKVDFARVLFTARNEFDAGDLQYTVNDEKGALLSETTVTYNNTCPAISKTLVYKDAAVQSKIVVDYSASQFNNRNQVVNSTKKVNVYGKDDNLLSSTIVTYDQHGNKTGQNKAAVADIKEPAPVKTVKAAATTGGNVQPKPAVKETAATGDQTEKRDEKYRDDKTLEKVVVTTMEGGKPVSAVITLYATDGKTVIKTFTMDMSGLSYDPSSNMVNGALSMTAHLGGNTLNSASSIQF